MLLLSDVLIVRQRAEAVETLLCKECVYFMDIYCEVGVCLQSTDLITWGQMNVALAWLAGDFHVLFYPW